MKEVEINGRKYTIRRPGPIGAMEIAKVTSLLHSLRADHGIPKETQDTLTVQLASVPPEHRDRYAETYVSVTLGLVEACLEKPKVTRETMDGLVQAEDILPLAIAITELITEGQAAANPT